MTLAKGVSLGLWLISDVAKLTDKFNSHLPDLEDVLISSASYSDRCLLLASFS